MKWFRRKAILIGNPSIIRTYFFLIPIPVLFRNSIIEMLSFVSRSLYFIIDYPAIPVIEKW